MSPITNLNRYSDGLKDCPRISPSSGYYMYLGKKQQIQQIEENYNLIKKMVENKHTTKC
jgi:hypothetical protein